MKNITFLALANKGQALLPFEGFPRYFKTKGFIDEKINKALYFWCFYVVI